MIAILLFFFHIIGKANTFKWMHHPLEKRIAYIYDIKKIQDIDRITIHKLQTIFKTCPLIVFKGVDMISPNQFINFLKEFDPDHDVEALANPDKHPRQMLQPFDQFPDCKHVAPRGNVKLNNFYDIKNINIEPSDHFINNYLWHTDILGHEYKLPNVITGFYIVEQPLIGGDTDFISGETIYENLVYEERIACETMLIEINRHKFITDKSIRMDYAGVNRKEIFINYKIGSVEIPILFAPDHPYELPRILLLPSFFEKVVGWGIDESRKWIHDFMLKKVLPHRVSVQWKKGDLAIFNNRRFMHSSTPARNYMDNPDSSKRLLLQTFLPTTRPLRGYQPKKEDKYVSHNLGWAREKSRSAHMVHSHIEFTQDILNKYNQTVEEDGSYILRKKA
jgi:alpha-ketoglutarate-dependent taurine dioxygenase